MYVLYDSENQHRITCISPYSIYKIVVVMDMGCVLGDVKPHVLNFLIYTTCFTVVHLSVQVHLSRHCVTRDS